MWTILYNNRQVLISRILISFQLIMMIFVRTKGISKVNILLKCKYVIDIMIIIIIITRVFDETVNYVKFILFTCGVWK